MTSERKKTDIFPTKYLKNILLVYDIYFLPSLWYLLHMFLFKKMKASYEKSSYILYTSGLSN